MGEFSGDLDGEGWKTVFGEFWGFGGLSTVICMFVVIGVDWIFGVFSRSEMDL
jgi:hypothetical protein